MTISVSGTPTVASGTFGGISTLSVTVNAAYNGLFLFVYNASATTVVTGASCPKVPGGFNLLPLGTGTNGISQFWLLYGTATSTGATTVTFTASAAFATGNRFTCQQLATSLSSSVAWNIDGWGYQNDPGSTSCPLPSLTPSATGMTYLGYVKGAATPSGSTAGTGFTRTTPSGTNDSIVTEVSCPVSAQAPVVTQSSTSFESQAMAAIIRETAPPSAPTNQFMPFFM